MEGTKKIKAISNTDCLCWKCLKEHDKDKIHTINIIGLGYGSKFDNLSTKLQLCDDCYNEHTDWWELAVISDNDLEYYEHEKEIVNYIDELPLQSQQFVWNEYAYGACADFYMNAQDWIDYQLGTLSHEKCKEYGIYSPDEKQAYEDRFPTCQHPVEIIYSDGSNDCHCPFGASGKCKDGVVSVGINMWEECYKCRYYKQRTTPVMRINSSDEDDYNLYVEYQLNKDRLEQKFGEMLKGVV